MAIKIQLRRGTAANWTSTNPILSDGEVGFETDTGKFKIGRDATAWTSLAYATDLPSQIEDMVSDLSNVVSSHTSSTTNVHGIANTAVLETTSGAQIKADGAEANANTYTDNALAGLVDSAPSLLNTLNELAAALGDDPNFATTIASDLAAKATLTIKTATQWSNDNPVLPAGEFGYISTNKRVKIGDGITAWNDLLYIPTATEMGELHETILLHEGLTTNVHGIANTAVLETTSGAQIKADGAEANAKAYTDTAEANANSYADSAIATYNLDTTNVHGIADTAELITTSDLNAHNQDSLNVHGIANTAALATLSDLSTHEQDTLGIHGIANTALLLTTSDLATFQGNVDAVESALALKAPIANAIFTGTIALPATTTIGDTTGTELGYVHGVTSGIQGQIDAKAPINNPTFTGTVAGITKTMVGLTNVDNTSDANKPISTAAQSALDLKAPLANATLTGTVVLPATTSIGNVSATEIGYVDGVTSAIQTQLDSKLASSTASSTYAPLANPTFTGTVSGVTKAMVGLGNVDNTSDANKPISTATQSALDLKAPLDGPIFTGSVSLPSGTTNIGQITYDTLSHIIGVTSDIQPQLDSKAPSEAPTLANTTFTGSVTGLTKSNVGLANVNNTSDANKPISTATQAALDLKAPLANATFTGTLIAPTINATDLTTANLTVTGTQTIVNSTNLAVADSLIYLADSQYSSDVLDIGIYGAYGNGGTNSSNHPHTGLVRDASDGVWKLISGAAEPTDSVVDFTGVTYDTLKIGDLQATSATIGNVSNTELQYLDGVTSAIQTQINAKAPTASPTFTGTVTLPTGTVTSAMILDGTIVDADISASAAIAVSKLAASTISGVTLGSNLNALTIGTGLTGTSYNGSGAVTVAIDSTVVTLTGSQTLTNKTLTSPSITTPTVSSGTLTVASAGITFADSTIQTSAGVPSLTTIKTALAANTSTSALTSALTYRDSLVPITGAVNLTVDADGTNSITFPIGTSIDFYQQSGTGAVFVQGAGVTLQYTPGLKFRTTFSSATITKVANNTWLVYGDLMA